MVFQIPKVGVPLEIVTSPVGNDAGIQDMHLSHTPPIEPLLIKQMVKDSLVSHLDVTQPDPYPADSAAFWYCTEIGRVSYPTNSSINPAVYRWNSHLLELAEVIFLIPSKGNP